MTRSFWLPALFLLLAASFAPAQEQTSAQEKTMQPPRTMAEELDRSLKGGEDLLVTMAEDMPADKYAYVPTQGEYKGVRSFGGQLKHVATANYLFGAGILGEKPPVDLGGGPDGPKDITSKEDIVRFLKDSFEYCHGALATITPQNATEWIPNPFGGKNPMTRLQLALISVGHGADHYGQLVSYFRLNGMIPPASRPRPQQN